MNTKKQNCLQHWVAWVHFQSKLQMKIQNGCQLPRATHAGLIKMPFECVKKSTWISFVQLPQVLPLFLLQTSRLSQSHKICGKLKSQGGAEKKLKRREKWKCLEISTDMNTHTSVYAWNWMWMRMAWPADKTACTHIHPYRHTHTHIHTCRVAQTYQSISLHCCRQLSWGCRFSVLYF